MIGARNGRCTRPDDDDFQVVEGFALEFSSVEKSGSGDDGGPVLIVVHHRNVRGFGDATLNLKALGCFDVLKVDAAKGLRDVDNGVHELLRVFGVHLNVEHIDAGEGLQQKALALHHRFARQSANVAQTEDSRAVGDNSHEVSL